MCVGVCVSTNYIQYLLVYYVPMYMPCFVRARVRAGVCVSLNTLPEEMFTLNNMSPQITTNQMNIQVELGFMLRDQQDDALL